MQIGLQRRDRETHRPVRERRRLVELDRHPVEAADVGEPASLDQRFRGRVTIGNGDANGDTVVNVADVFYMINFLFAGGPAPH